MTEPPDQRSDPGRRDAEHGPQPGSVSPPRQGVDPLERVVDPRYGTEKGGLDEPREDHACRPPRDAPFPAIGGGGVRRRSGGARPPRARGPGNRSRAYDRTQRRRGSPGKKTIPNMPNVLPAALRVPAVAFTPPRPGPPTGTPRTPAGPAPRTASVVPCGGGHNPGGAPRAENAA